MQKQIKLLIYSKTNNVMNRTAIEKRLNFLKNDRKYRFWIEIAFLNMALRV